MAKTPRTAGAFSRKVAVAALIIGSVVSNIGVASAAVLTTASVTQSDPRASQTSNYAFLTSNVTTSLTRCFKEVYATTSTGTAVPTGFSSTAATVNTGSTNYLTTTGFALDATTNGTLKYTLAGGATPPSSSARTFQVDGITNGSTTGVTYFLQFSTYSDAACTIAIDSVTLAFVYTDGQSVSITVDPTLTFTVSAVASGGTVNSATSNVTTTSTSVPLGTPTISTNQIAAQDVAVSTNAGSGYTVYIRYTGAPASGSNTLASHSGTNAAPTVFSAAGTEAFGYTTNNFTLGTGTANRFSANKWAAFTTSNNEVAFSSAPVSAQTTRLGYQIGIAGITKAGNYTTTVIYTAIPVF